MDETIANILVPIAIVAGIAIFLYVLFKFMEINKKRNYPLT